MGRYYNPVDKIVSGEVGRRLLGDPSDFDFAKSQHHNEHLYVLVDRVVFKQVACVDRRDDFNEFYNQYRMGVLLQFQLVALNEKDHQSTAPS